VLTLPIFVIAMAGIIPSAALMRLLHEHMASLNWIQLALATPVVLWCGWPFFERAWKSLVHCSPNMFTLIAIGVGAAYLYSLAATVVPNIFPAGFRNPAGAIEPYFDSAAVIVVLVLFGQVLELRARSQTGAAIRALLGLAPKTGTLTEGKPKLVTVEPIGTFSSHRLLAIAAGLELASEHPLATAIVQGAKDRTVDPERLQDFQSVTGKGVRGQSAGSRVAIGSACDDEGGGGGDK